MIQKRILIVEDDVLISEHLKDILVSYQFQNCEIAHTKEKAIHLFEQFKPELVLLDVRMGDEEAGIELGSLLNQHYSIPFIYITAHSDDATLQKIIQNKPSSYINKPFKRLEVYMAVSLVLNREQEEEATLLLKDGYVEHLVEIPHILYATSEKNYLSVYTEGKKYVIRNTMEWFISQLPEKQFIRTHRSFVVNRKHITQVGSDYLFISNEKIPISRQNSEKVKDFLRNPSNL